MYPSFVLMFCCCIKIVNRAESNAYMFTAFGSIGWRTSTLNSSNAPLAKCKSVIERQSLSIHSSILDLCASVSTDGKYKQSRWMLDTNNIYNNIRLRETLTENGKMWCWCCVCLWVLCYEPRSSIFATINIFVVSIFIYIDGFWICIV